MSAFFGDDTKRPDYRAMCKYGENCYQKNPMHLEKFRHPNKDVKAKENIDSNNSMAQDTSQNDSKVKDDKKAKRKAEDKDPQEDNVDGKDEDADCKRARLDSKESEEKTESKGEPEKNASKENKLNDLDKIPDSPEDVKESIVQKFLVKMPEEFYNFWDFCKEKNPEHPEDALVDICGLRLVGAFDVLSGKLRKNSNRSAEDYLIHYRYYYDTPEFQTIIASTETNFHIGYFRDEPNEDPLFVLSNDPDTNGCKFDEIGQNLFDAIYNYIEKLAKAKDCDPFKQAALTKFKESLHTYSNLKVPPKKENVNQRRKKRDYKVKMTSIFHGAKLVVNYPKNVPVEIRDVSETDAGLRKIFKDMNEASNEKDQKNAENVLHEVLTNIQFANDENDPSLGLTWGLNAFCYGGEKLHRFIGILLSVGYNIVNRAEFSKIITAHLKRRQRNGCFKIE